MWHGGVASGPGILYKKVGNYGYMLLYHYDVMHKLTANYQIVVSELAILNIDMTLIKCIIYYSVVYLSMQRHDLMHSATASHVLLCHTMDIPFSSA